MTTAVPLTDQALAGALRELRTAAPPSVGFGALVEAGLADRYAAIDTPLGAAFVAWNGRGVSWVSPAGDPEGFEGRFRRDIGRAIQAADSLPPRLAGAITRRLGGDRRVQIPLDLRGHTPFEVAVWTKALEIPRGEVRPYGWIAAEIGRPKAVRAVGTALAHNPVPLVVPCHRVVRSDGMIGQYSMGGPEAKRRVLASEGLDTHWLEAEAAAGNDPHRLPPHVPRRAAGDRPAPRLVRDPPRRRDGRLPAMQALPPGRPRRGLRSVARHLARSSGLR